jgi:hypothetical protein
MKCTRVGTGFVCGSAPSRKRCSVPGCAEWSARECDYPVKRAPGKSQTCDAKLCERHAAKVGDNLDHCPAHVKLAAEKVTP